MVGCSAIIATSFIALLFQSSKSHPAAPAKGLSSAECWVSEHPPTHPPQLHCGQREAASDKREKRRARALAAAFYWRWNARDWISFAWPRFHLTAARLQYVRVPIAPPSITAAVVKFKVRLWKAFICYWKNENIIENLNQNALFTNVYGLILNNS